MQSQQKKVKWSRGETASALEERTDTGITQVSVDKMENIIADIYGNISRRPALKVIDNTSNTEIPLIQASSVQPVDNEFNKYPETFVFTIDANTYIVFFRIESFNLQGLLIHNNKFVRKIIVQTSDLDSIYDSGHISTTQYNNFMIVSNCWLSVAVLRLTGTSLSTYEVTAEQFKFSAPWYAPNGTNSIRISGSDLAGLEFNKDGAGFFGTTYTEPNGTVVACKAIDTGLTESVSNIASKISIGSIVEFPNMGTYMRVEGFSLGSGNVYFSDIVFSNLVYGNNPIPSTGYCAGYRVVPLMDTAFVLAYYNGNLIKSVQVNKLDDIVVRSTVSSTGYSHTSSSLGSWQNKTVTSLKVFMYGELLTPVAAEQEKDTTVVVETGYVSLNNYQPKKFTFSNQRLYAAGFENQDLTPKQIPGFAVGSQIARYNDFKNNYNTQTEAITIDISTSYQEQIINIIDYNGLKILTDSAEYAYTNDGVIKQSENGSLETCKPIVFGSVCIYADKSKHQLRAMEYELQNNLFSSSSINQMTQEDLIFNTTSLGGFIDKENFTGHFLFATQTGNSSNNTQALHSLAVCNLVPGNQAAIWTRWDTPKILSEYERTPFNSIKSVIEINNKIWFVTGCILNYVNNDGNSYRHYPAYTLTELDDNNVLDYESEAQNIDIVYQLIKPVANGDSVYYAWVDSNNNVTLYSKNIYVQAGDLLYTFNSNGTIREYAYADNTPTASDITIGSVKYYAWATSSGTTTVYTTSQTPELVGDKDDPSRAIYNNSGQVIQTSYISGCANDPYHEKPYIVVSLKEEPPYPVQPTFYYRKFTNLQYTYGGSQKTAVFTPLKNKYITIATIPGTVSVFDGDEYKWDDTLTTTGNYTQSLTELTNPRVGFMVNATLESHPLDVGGKTYTDHKRIGKAVAVIRNTEPNAFKVCDKTGYTSEDKKTVNFYGCTGMKNQVKYTINNIQGAKFTIESLTMIIEYATLDS